jgi:hypothetical protein
MRKWASCFQCGRYPRFSGRGARTGVAARRIGALLFIVALGFLGTRAIHAAQVEAVTVEVDGNTFHITLDALVDGTQARVYQVLSDYARLDRVNPGIRSISVRPSPANAGKRVRSVLADCVWFFCREIVQVQDVTEPNPFTIVGKVVPGEGDFAAGSFAWHVTAEGARTRVRYEASQVPRFWVPPLIGPWMIKRTLHDQLAYSVAVLERLAAEPVSRASVGSPEPSDFGSSGETR